MQQIHQWTCAGGESTSCLLTSTH